MLFILFDLVFVFSLILYLLHFLLPYLFTPFLFLYSSSWFSPTFFHFPYFPTPLRHQLNSLILLDSLPCSSPPVVPSLSSLLSLLCPFLSFPVLLCLFLRLPPCLTTPVAPLHTLIFLPWILHFHTTWSSWTLQHLAHIIKQFKIFHIFRGWKKHTIFFDDCLIENDDYIWRTSHDRC